MAEFRLGRLKFNWRGAWAGSTAYVIDDIIRFGANSYVCIGNHTSQALAANFTSDAAYWQLHTGGFEYSGDFAISTAYVVDDIIKEGGNLYICTNQHTSTGVASAWYSTDYPLHWELFQEGLNFRGAFATDTYYGINDVVSFGPRYYRCTSPFTVAGDIDTELTDPAGIGSDGFYPPAANFDEFSQGLSNEGQYTSTARYQR